MLPRFVNSEKFWIDLYVSGVDLQELVAVLPADVKMMYTVMNCQIENLYCFVNSETFVTFPWRHSTLKSHQCDD